MKISLRFALGLGLALGCLTLGVSIGCEVRSYNSVAGAQSNPQGVTLCGSGAAAANGKVTVISLPGNLLRINIDVPVGMLGADGYYPGPRTYTSSPGEKKHWKLKYIEVVPTIFNSDNKVYGQFHFFGGPAVSGGSGSLGTMEGRVEYEDTPQGRFVRLLNLSVPGNYMYSFDYSFVGCPR